jgi:hypothetical protein
VDAEREFICPMPMAWDDIHRKLRAAWESAGRLGDEPPVPLILNGWVFTSDLDKKLRWDETIAWAKARSLEHLVPHLSKTQRYEVMNPTGAVSLTFCPGSYRDLRASMVRDATESVLCPECGAALRPAFERHEAGDKVGQSFAYIPSHDRAD